MIARVPRWITVFLVGLGLPLVVAWVEFKLRWFLRELKQRRARAEVERSLNKLLEILRSVKTDDLGPPGTLDESAKATFSERLRNSPQLQELQSALRSFERAILFVDNSVERRTRVNELIRLMKTQGILGNSDHPSPSEAEPGVTGSKTAPEGPLP
jgi:hypothetical protein